MSAKQRPIASDLRRVDRTADHAIDYQDNPPLDESFLTRPLVEWPPTKETITIRIDVDVLAWFRQGGRGYQTRINQVLRRFVEGQPARRARRRRAPPGASRKPPQAVGRRP